MDVVRYGQNSGEKQGQKGGEMPSVGHSCELFYPIVTGVGQESETISVPIKVVYGIHFDCHDRGDVNILGGIIETRLKEMDIETIFDK